MSPTPSTPAPLTILIVDDQSATRVALTAELDRVGHRVLEADSASWALELFRRYRPDIVLMDVEMPGQDGYWTAREMRAAEPGGWTPIIFLSQFNQAADVWKGIESGGDDYLVKPVSPMILHAKLRAMQRLAQMRQRLVKMSEELRTANAQLEKLSTVDALTGLMNRRALDARLQQELELARREAKPLTLVLCDVDHFKRYNDTAGHVAGDACLRRVAQLLKETCRRPSDCAGRYGGEEFALVLPNTPRSGAMTYARALIRTIELAAIPHPDSPTGASITLSGGITTCLPDESTSAEGLILRADDALYNAKSTGRNRFFSYEMQMDTEEQRRRTSAS
ncbi:GGDEF domain-containing response regulator [Roseateles amylovorans]|uniref:diguanylate cyclase n=1 Tax=Roseateles amylovorans TaxID=2978473 RepID=A0ABY6B0V9_9BURK|nr:diguanylate cyclase [Roseateles amylovorans]UXH79034.1 diguanylate cyclase [Roseateles amylovorans]